MEMGTDRIEQLKEQLQSLPTLHAKAQFVMTQLREIAVTAPQPLLIIADSLLAEAWIARDRAALPYLLRSKAVLHTHLSQFNKGHEAYGELLRYACESENLAMQAMALQGLGIIHRLQGETVQAIDCFHQALEQSRRIHNPEAIAANSNSLGICYTLLGQFDRALEAYHESLEAYQAGNNQDGLVTALQNIANMYLNMGDHSKALKHYQEYLELQPIRTNPSSAGKALQGMARIYLEQGGYAEAIRSATEAWELFAQLQDKMGEAKSIGTLGLINRATGNTAEALAQFRRAGEIAQQIGDTETFVVSLHHAGSTLMQMGQTADARNQLEQAERAAARHNLRDLHLAICGDLADACSQQEDFPNAYRYRTQQLRLQHEVGSHQKQKALAELQTRYDLERAQKERELFKLKSEQLQMMVEYKTSELSSIALSLIHKQELLESLAGRLRQLQKFSAAEATAQLELLLEELTAQATSGSGWTLFKGNLRQSDQSFLRRLAEHYPLLTPTELQVCALIKMEMASKDIASILGVSVRDVESHRYNLRKKLPLSANESLATFLSREEFWAADKDRTAANDQEFTEQLLKQFPELSSKELKICALLKAGLSTKEITQLLSVSDRTVENHRYHIRKKLNLPPNSNLATFFATL